MIAPLAAARTFAPAIPGQDALTTRPAPAATATGFGQALADAASAAATTLRQGEAAAAGGIIGTIPVQQAVDQILAAERTLQAAVAIRDKLVSAYTEITRMQI